MSVTFNKKRKILFSSWLIEWLCIMEAVNVAVLKFPGTMVLQVSTVMPVCGF